MAPTIHVGEVYHRGLDDFASLSPFERDVFVVHELNLYYEMEGGFEDYLLSGGHTAELAWLAGTLQRVQDYASADVLRQLMAMTDRQREAMGPLCDSYYKLVEARWGAIDRYLHQQGLAVAR